jgi:hypothetical protein
MGYYVNSQHILVGPKVIYKPIPEAATAPKIVPWSLILHSNSGPAYTRWERLWAYMNRADITIESHLQIDLDGTIVQMVPFNVRADCNAHANQFVVNGQRVGAISIETADNGAAALATQPWSMAQLNAIVGATAAVGHKYGVPYSSPTAWNDRGVGYHSQYKEWSIYRGKTCPGPARIRQMDYIRAEAARTCACAPG